jgi:hypothetical protein
MEPRVLITYHDNNTYEDFMRSSQTSLGHFKRVNAEAGTIVVLMNLFSKTIFAICMLANWEGTTSPCRLRHFLDADLYGDNYKKYNKYEICVGSIRILKKPMSFDEIKMLVGGSDSVKWTNMWKKSNNSYVAPFATEGDKETVKRFEILAKSLL